MQAVLSTNIIPSDLDGHNHIQMMIICKKTDNQIALLNIHGCACLTRGTCADDDGGYDAYGKDFSFDMDSFNTFIDSVRNKTTCEFNVVLADEIISFEYDAKTNCIAIVHESWVSNMRVFLKNTRQIIANIQHCGNIIATYVDECNNLRQAAFEPNVKTDEESVSDRDETDVVTEDIAGEIQEIMSRHIESAIKNAEDDQSYEKVESDDAVKPASSGILSYFW